MDVTGDSCHRTAFHASVWVSAQQTTVVCLSQYNWMDNSKSQNPCLVASFAMGACTGGQFTPLDSGASYVGPYAVAATLCECNTITYNLIAACAVCQDGTCLHWSSWSTNCSTVYPGMYPEDIPSGTAIPHWAYQDVVVSDNFNVTLAQLTGDAPESTATAVTSTPPASITSSGNSGTQSPPSSSVSSSSKSNTGMIVGGAVGGIVVFGAIATFITCSWFYFRRRRQTSAPPGGTMSTTTSPFVHPATQLKFYDPSDPSTFLPSPTIYTSPFAIRQSNSIPSNIHAAQCGHPIAYSGIPEI